MVVGSGAVTEVSPEDDFEEDLRPVSESQIDLQLVERGVPYDDDYDSAAEELSQQQFVQDAMRKRDARKRAKELQDAADMPPPQSMARRRSLRQPSEREQSVFPQDSQDDEPQPRESRESRRSRDYDRSNEEA